MTDQQRQTLEVTGYEFVHHSVPSFPLDAMLRMMQGAPLDPMLGVATCRSSRGQTMCSCGYYWLRWV